MQQRCAKASQAGRGSLACRAQAVAAPVFATTPTPSKTETVRVAVLGASGYTGAEVMRLTALHPGIRITALTGEKQAGKPFSDVFPHLATAAHVPKLVKINDVDYSQVDAIFCCLPHATTQVPITALWADWCSLSVYRGSGQPARQLCHISSSCMLHLRKLPHEVISKLPEHLKVVDLSADFRLKDPASYAQWYGHEHAAVELQKTAVYGLTELYREQIKGARLLANPGCYPTCVQLPLYPLIKAKLVLTDDIIIDAKSGVSGAGRAAKESNLYCEIAEGINSYSVGKHRHMPEIEQGLSEAAGTAVNVSFTPHLINMSRGMQTTSYVKMAPGVSVDDLRAHLAKVYENEFFVKVLSKDVVPHTRHVRGTNFCMMNVFEDRLQGRAVVISVIDNLVKGASGQALQNLNLMLGYPETTALQQLAMFP
ncbi:semialdhyde_dh domain-containing protein [Haematococcus lacustris]|uniref:Probable N-acetyl-gamma-glutamyl-phosphate reductase, chloroplastic n=1 Tax=Haematococcus lacustris TaxID=44745 RepID=A0A699ZY96_HAELA|nr:semialdhyde_dh domain-containing protein [Haematococcus lacustris]